MVKPSRLGQLCAGIGVLMVLLAVSATRTATQTPSPADGPWSGQAQCVMTARGPNYQNDETHTWQLTGQPPIISGAFRQWPAVWSVQGRGSRLLPSPIPGAAAALGGPSETWSINVPGTSAPVSFWEPPGSGRIRVSSQHSYLVANGAIAGQTGAPGSQTSFSGALQEWEFPVADDVATSTSISGTRARTVVGRGWRQPSTVLTTETCTWNFTKGGGGQRGATTNAGGARGQTAGRLGSSGGGASLGSPAAPPATGSSARGAPPPAGGLTSAAGGAAPTDAEQLAAFLKLNTVDPATDPPPPSDPSDLRNPLGPVTNSGAPGATPSPVAPGTYLVTVNGLICGQPTADSIAGGIGDPDGRGDEAYAAVYVRRFDRMSSQLLESTVRQTIPYGDIANFGTSRLQGGTQTSTGGIQAKDWIPADLGVTRLSPAQESSFPWRIWEGQLTGADALLITPTVWEYDGGGAVFQEWVQSQSVLNNTILLDPGVQGRVATQGFGPIEVGATVPTFQSLPQQIINGRQDRPIGLRASGSGTQLPNITLVLTREIIDKALSSSWATVQLPVVPGLQLNIPKPGILVLNFVDTPAGSPSAAAYTMILQVERLGN